MTRQRKTVEQMYKILVTVSEQYGNDWFYIDDVIDALECVDTGVSTELRNKDVPNRLNDMLNDGLLEKEIAPKGRAFNRYRLTDEGLKFIKREREHRERQETLAQKLVQKLAQEEEQEEQEEQEQVKLPAPSHFKINFRLSKDMIEGMVKAYNEGKEEVTITVDSKEE